jgi:hypothetical protein
MLNLYLTQNFKLIRNDKYNYSIKFNKMKQGKGWLVWVIMGIFYVSFVEDVSKGGRDDHLFF